VDLDPDRGDFLLFPERVELPRTGLLGVFLDDGREGVRVRGFADDSPAEQAGLKKGDLILKIAGSDIDSYSDIRFVLMDRAPGDEVPVEVMRASLFLGDELLSYRVKLF
jgi:S1-C subfamily serine protease